MVWTALGSQAITTNQAKLHSASTDYCTTAGRRRLDGNSRAAVCHVRRRIPPVDARHSCCVTRVPGPSSVLLHVQYLFLHLIRLCRGRMQALLPRALRSAISIKLAAVLGSSLYDNRSRKFAQSMAFDLDGLHQNSANPPIQSSKRLFLVTKSRDKVPNRPPTAMKDLWRHILYTDPRICS